MQCGDTMQHSLFATKRPALIFLDTVLSRIIGCCPLPRTVASSRRPRSRDAVSVLERSLEVPASSLLPSMLQWMFTSIQRTHVRSYSIVAGLPGEVMLCNGHGVL